MMHRILFFVEPYSVRSGPDDFRSPFEFFLRIARSVALRPDVEVALVCSSHFAGFAPRGMHCFTPAQFEIDETPQADWAEHWPKMLRGEACGSWGAFYEQVVREFRPTLAFAWNKNDLFAKACRGTGIGVVTLEYGSVRTRSGFRISVDPRGFGPASALATRAFEPTDNAAKAGWEWAASHVCGDALGMWRRDEKPRRAGEIHACVLLQKEDDVNFIVWPAFETMWHFVEHVLQGLCRESNVRVSVRPHPAGLESYDERIARRFPTVSIERDGCSYYHALMEYDCVLTLNSAAGFEALLCRIPAMTFAESAYPCAFDARRDGDVGKFMRLVRNGGFWTPERLRHVGHFAQRLVRQYSMPQELLTEPSIYLRMIDAWSGLSPAELDAWFEETPARLATLVDGCDDAIRAAQFGILRFENSLRAGETHAAITRLEALSRALVQSGQTAGEGGSFEQLLRQVHAHVEALAEMTRHNEQRDLAIAAATAELHRQSQAMAEQIRRADESGSRIHALLEQVHLQSKMLAEIWALVRPTTTAR